MPRRAAPVMRCQEIRWPHWTWSNVQCRLEQTTQGASHEEYALGAQRTPHPLGDPTA